MHERVTPFQSLKDDTDILSHEAQEDRHDGLRIRQRRECVRIARAGTDKGLYALALSYKGAHLLRGCRRIFHGFRGCERLDSRVACGPSSCDWGVPGAVDVE